MYFTNEWFYIINNINLFFIIQSLDEFLAKKYTKFDQFKLNNSIQNLIKNEKKNC